MISEIEYAENPATSGSYALVGIAAALAVGQHTWSEPEQPIYVVSGGIGTHSTFMDQVFTAPHPAEASGFAKELSEIYASLSEGQEMLGSEFEALWDANVANLYES